MCIRKFAWCCLCLALALQAAPGWAKGDLSTQSGSEPGDDVRLSLEQVQETLTVSLEQLGMPQKLIARYRKALEAAPHVGFSAKVMRRVIERDLIRSTNDGAEPTRVQSERLDVLEQAMRGYEKTLWARDGGES